MMKLIKSLSQYHAPCLTAIVMCGIRGIETLGVLPNMRSRGLCKCKGCFEQNALSDKTANYYF